jgi:hypothetical protein
MTKASYIVSRRSTKRAISGDSTAVALVRAGDARCCYQDRLTRLRDRPIAGTIDAPVVGRAVSPTTPLARPRRRAGRVEVRSPSFTALPGTLAVSHVPARAASSNDYSSKIIRIPGHGLRVAVMPIAAPRIASAGSVRDRLIAGGVHGTVRREPLSTGRERLECSGELGKCRAIVNLTLGSEDR